MALMARTFHTVVNHLASIYHHIADGYAEVIIYHSRFTPVSFGIDYPVTEWSNTTAHASFWFDAENTRQHSLLEMLEMLLLMAPPTSVFSVVPLARPNPAGPMPMQASTPYVMWREMAQIMSSKYTVPAEGADAAWDLLFTAISRPRWIEFFAQMRERAAAHCDSFLNVYLHLHEKTK